MKFKEKVKSMTGKEIVLAMIDGLENPDTEISMHTFGNTDGVICSGCAATNAVAKIMNYHWTPETIINHPEWVDDIDFFIMFENAIDCLRSNDFLGYNNRAIQQGFAQLSFARLPFLGKRYKECLFAWKEYANSL